MSSERIDIHYLHRKRPLAERLAARTNKSAPNGCWEWQGFRYEGGYGKIIDKGEGFLTHRVAFALANGPIPDGLCVCHKCDNPRCINPDHLFLGTYAENTADAVAKGRHTHGERHGNAKLTEAQVAEIVNSVEPRLVLERRYGVSRGTINRNSRRANVDARSTSRATRTSRRVA